MSIEATQDYLFIIYCAPAKGKKRCKVNRPGLGA
jgi:hypothetical protein